MHAALFVNYVKAISDIRGSRVTIIPVLGLSAIEPVHIIRQNGFSASIAAAMAGGDGRLSHWAIAFVRILPFIWCGLTL